MEELNYIMESKPEKGLLIYFHYEEPRIDAGDRSNATIATDTDLVRRNEIYSDHQLPWLATLASRVASES
ncbi:MAG: hypothetical protein ACKPKO_01120, partial [Candidatus Fonsibacter sp.]